MANDLIVTFECNIKDYSDLENDRKAISFDPDTTIIASGIVGPNDSPVQCGIFMGNMKIIGRVVGNE